MKRLFLFLFCLFLSQVKANEINVPVKVENSEIIPKFTYTLEHSEQSEENPLGLFKLTQLPKNKTYKFDVRSSVPDCDIFRQEGEWSTQEEGGGYMWMPLNLCLPGQGFKGCLQAVDDNEKLTFTFVPNPLVSKSKKDSATMTAFLTFLQGNLYEISLENLDDEEVIFLSRSADEVMEKEVKLKEIGRITIAPAVIGLEGGIANFSIERKNGEVLSLDLMWGTAFNDYVEKNNKRDKQSVL